MSVSFTRWIVCWALVVAVPVSLLGQTPSAVLHTQGGVWVNGYEAKDSSAIFTGDLLETKPGFSASLTLDGSTVLLQPQSVAKLQDNMLVLDHGSVSVTTSRSFKVRVNCLTVVPVSNEWTQYDVADLNRTIQVAARKMTSTLSARSRLASRRPIAPVHMKARFTREKSTITTSPDCAARRRNLPEPRRSIPSGLSEQPLESSFWSACSSVTDTTR